jgi:transposase-like protein
MVADKVRQRVARQLGVNPMTVYRAWELAFLAQAKGVRALVQSVRKERSKPVLKAISRGKGGGFKRLDFSKRLNTEKK